MPNRKNTRRTPLTSRWMWLTLVPLYLFTLVLVLGPLVYMLVLSFETRADLWGVIPQFTLANYKNIFQPVYLNTFVQSLKLALLCTGLILLIGYPFGYFMARLSPRGKKFMTAALMIPFWTNSLIRLYGWIIVLRSGGTLDKVLMALHLTQRPLKLLYTYPAVVVDDARMGVTEVVRGSDLLSSTARQLYLYRLLGLQAPQFAHCPLLLAPDGRRLSKRDGDQSLENLRAKYTAEEIVGKLAYAYGLQPEPAPRTPESLIPEFSWAKVPKEDVCLPEGLF